MTIIGRSWITLTLFFIVLSSVKIIRNDRNHKKYKDLQLHELLDMCSDISLAGGLAMAMSFSMDMPMPVPPFMQPIPMPMPVPIPVKIPVLQLENHQSTQQQPPQQAIGNCRCQQVNQPPQQGCPPCPYYQQPQQQYPQQQYPQQQYPQQQYPQQTCCQNNYNPPQASRPQCVVCRPGQRPGQPYPPGNNGLVPVAQVVLSPVLNRGKKCNSDESDSDSSSDSEDSDGCSHRCRKRLARMNAERRDTRERHKRMNKNKYTKTELLNLRNNNFDTSHKDSLLPVLEYVSRDGDVKFKTKISDDEALELLGQDFVNNGDLKNEVEYSKDIQFNTRKIYPNNEVDNVAQPNIRLMRAGEPIVLKNKVQHQILNPGKKELVFQSPKGNDITNLSLTFLFS